MSEVAMTIESAYRSSRLRLVLVIILSVAVAGLYWIDHEYTAACRDETGFLLSVGLPFDYVIALLDIVGDCVGIAGLVAYLAVITMLILGRTVYSFLRAVPLIIIGVPILGAILIGEGMPDWLTLIIVWGVPAAVGSTLLPELFLHFRPLARRE